MFAVPIDPISYAEFGPICVVAKLGETTLLLSCGPFALVNCPLVDQNVCYDLGIKTANMASLWH